MLMFSTLIIICAILVKSQTTIVAGFDEENISPRGPPFLVGTYKGLLFGNFYYENPRDDTGNVPYGLHPSSGSNVALYYTPALKSAPLPVIKGLHLKNSFITSFNLTSFKFGCAVGRNGVAYGVSRCFLAVFGYRDGERVATQAFPFLPDTRAATADLMLATLSDDFQNIDTVRFATAYTPYVALRAQISGFTGSTWFDDMEFTVYEGGTKTPNNIPISTTGRCGQEFGVRCPDTKCCSRFDYCSPLIEPGLDLSAWCSPGVCQIGWGKCDPVSPTSLKFPAASKFNATL